MPDQFIETDSGLFMARRRILAGGAMGGIALAAMGAGVANAASLLSPGKDAGAQKISFRNQHTGESFSGAFKVGGRYLPDAFEQINEVLRDFRTGEVFPIDPRVVDILFAVREKANVKTPYEVLSGYRSPKTNSTLARNGTGVARNSLHMTGQAIDVRLPGVSTRKLADLAQGMRSGGVGYYAKSNFVHMDTGQVRRWNQA